MDIVVQGFKGEIPILDVKALPDMAASEAVNCDFKSGALRSLPAYKSSAVTGTGGSKVFFLSDSDPSTDMKAYLANSSFHGVPAPVINDERVVFVFNEGAGPKKSTIDNFTITSLSDGYYRDVSSKDLGIPRPASPLEVEKEPTYTDYSASKVYYQEDIVNVHDKSEDYSSYLIICTDTSSVGKFADVWNDDKSKSKWKWINRWEWVAETAPSGATSSHYLMWPYREPSAEGAVKCWVKNSDDRIVKKGDLIQYADGDVYRARFDGINRHRPDDPPVWRFLVTLGDLAKGHAEVKEFNIRLYGEEKVYSQGEIAITYDPGRAVYFWCVCNRSGTKGVFPLSGSTAWSVISMWNAGDHFIQEGKVINNGTAEGVSVEVEYADGTLFGVVPCVFPYFTTFPASVSHPQYAFYRYVNNHGDDEFGLFVSDEGSSNIRPFNPAFGGENPWELYKTKEELAVDRSEVYDSVSYTWTWVSAWGEESKPAKPTDVIDANMSEIIKIKRPSIVVPDHIEGYRIYRLSGGMRSSEFLFFPKDGDIENGDFPAGYTSEIEDSNEYKSHIEHSQNLGEPVPTEDWDEPVEGLTGFVSLANGALAGFEGNGLYFSEPWVYYAWPIKYQVATQSKIVGLGAFDNTVVACTLAKPEVISCPLPGQVSVTISPHTKPCLSADSIVSGENHVIYAGHDGLVVIGQDGIPQDMTRKIIDEDTWRNSFTPKNIAGAYYDGQYWAVIKGTQKGFVIPFSQPEYMTMIDVSDTSIDSLQGISVCPYTGSLYLIGITGSTTHILIFGEGGSSFLVWKWKSKVFVADHYVGHSACKVDRPQGDSQSVNLKFYGDGEEKMDVNLTSSNPSRMPAGRYKEIQFQLSGQSQARVNFVKFSTQMHRI